MALSQSALSKVQSAPALNFVCFLCSLDIIAIQGLTSDEALSTVRYFSLSISLPPS